MIFQRVGRSIPCIDSASAAPAPIASPAAAILPPRGDAPRRSPWTTAPLLAGAALCALPFVSTGAGLLLGLCVALLFGNPHLARTRKLVPTLLSLSVIGLGFGMDLRVVARVGAHGVVATALGISVALLLGALLTRLLGVGRNVGALISVGTAICGGSAIAAMVPVLQPEEHETSVALACVFLLNGIALFAFPVVGRWAGLSDAQFGLFCALAIHDTSSVVGAAVAWGGTTAVAIATTVKLARALWIVPLTVAAGAFLRSRSRVRGGAHPAPAARRPWFILGFVAAAALVTWVPALQPAGHAVAGLARQALVVTLFLIGAGLTRASLRAVGPRPFALAVALWISMAALSLGAVSLGLIG